MYNLCPQFQADVWRFSILLRGTLRSRGATLIQPPPGHLPPGVLQLCGCYGGPWAESYREVSWLAWSGAQHREGEAGSVLGKGPLAGPTVSGETLTTIF